MKDRIYLIVKLIVRTKHQDIHEAIRELEEQTVLTIPGTSKTQVLECSILKTQSLHDKKIK